MFDPKDICCGLSREKKDEADLLVVVLQNEEGRTSVVGVEASLGSLRGVGKKMALFGLLI